MAPCSEKTDVEQAAECVGKSPQVSAESYSSWPAKLFQYFIPMPSEERNWTPNPETDNEEAVQLLDKSQQLLAEDFYICVTLLADDYGSKKYQARAHNILDLMDKAANVRQKLPKPLLADTDATQQEINGLKDKVQELEERLEKLEDLAGYVPETSSITLIQG